MPKLETIVANPVAQPTMGRPADVSTGYDILARGIAGIGEATQKIIESEYTSRTRAASAAAEKELYDLADELNNSNDYDKAEETYDKRSKEIMDRYRNDLPGLFYQDSFDESTGAFSERLRHGVSSEVRTKRIDSAKAGLDEEKVTRAQLYGKLFTDPAGQDVQANAFGQSVELQRQQGLITEREAVAYKQSFAEAARQEMQGEAKQARIHGRVLEVMAQAKTPQEARKLADESDPAIAEEVFRRVESRFNVIENNRTDAVRAQIDEAYPALDQAFTQGLRIGPGENDIVPPGPEAAFEQIRRMPNLSDEVRTRLENRVVAMTRKHDLVEENVFAREWDRLNILKNEKPLEFADEPLEDIRLRYPNYRTQIDKLIQDRNNIRNGIEPAATEVKRANELYSQFFEIPVNTYGQAKHPKDRARLQQFQLSYELAYSNESKQLGGRRLTREEEFKLAQDLLRPTFTEPKFFGLSETQHYRFEEPPVLGPSTPEAQEATRAAAPKAPVESNAPKIPGPQVLPPINPASARPYTNIKENVALAQEVELELIRQGLEPSLDDIVAGMNRKRAARR